MAYSCSGQYFPRVTCVARYGSLIRGDFERKVRNVLEDGDTYSSSYTPGESTFVHIRDADFLVQDLDEGLRIRGPRPSVGFMFSLEPASHEAPVYSPSTKELCFSRLEEAFLPQLVIDLERDPPNLTERLAKPPIYAAAGARFYRRLLYFARIGGNASLEGHRFRTGIYTLDPETGESKAILNNYYGYYFSAADDPDIDEEG